ncbi:MAG TPA: hypothetical protein VEL11_12680 [Candidatus Bathyarchaeia archaeon]|nr:hypothetical protein [Candidatus Bathyarchaeia archaeon]
MEIIECTLWTMTGFIPTLVSMELAWRLSKKRVRDAFVNRPIAVKQEIRSR